jgi:glycine/D-amino acid oxidase-like deaminating enzyme
VVRPLKTDVAIIGAGIIGLTTALRLAAGGREVVVIDPNEPASGASSGNAGTLAPYACVPVGNPDILRNLPGLLFNSESPLSIRPAALLALLPWLARFVRESLPKAARRNGYALAALLEEAMPAWRDLSEEAELSDLFGREGCLHVYLKGLPASHKDWGTCLREELGVRQEWLTPTEVAKLEPGLPSVSCGLFFPDAVHINPAVLSPAARGQSEVMRRFVRTHLRGATGSTGQRANPTPVSRSRCPCAFGRSCRWGLVAIAGSASRREHPARYGTRLSYRIRPWTLRSSSGLSARSSSAST